MKNTNEVDKLDFQDVSEHLGIHIPKNPKNISDKFVPPFDFESTEIKSSFVGTQISMSLFRLLLSRAILLVSLVGVTIATVMLNIDSNLRFAKQPSAVRSPSTAFVGVGDSLPLGTASPLKNRPIVTADPATAGLEEPSPARTGKARSPKKPAAVAADKPQPPKQPATIVANKPKQNDPRSTKPIFQYAPADAADPNQAVLAKARQDLDILSVNSLISQPIASKNTTPKALQSKRVRSQRGVKLATQKIKKSQVKVASNRSKSELRTASVQPSWQNTIALSPPFPNDLFTPSARTKDTASTQSPNNNPIPKRSKSRLLAKKASRASQPLIAIAELKPSNKSLDPITDAPTAIDPVTTAAITPESTTPLETTSIDTVAATTPTTTVPTAAVTPITLKPVDSNVVRQASALPNSAIVPPSSNSENAPTSDPTIVPPPPPPPPIIVGSVAPAENRTGIMPNSESATTPALPQPENVTPQPDRPTQQNVDLPSSPVANLPVTLDTSTSAPQPEDIIVPQQASTPLMEPLVATASIEGDTNSSPAVKAASTAKRDWLDPILFAPTTVAKILVDSPADEFSNNPPPRVASIPKKIALKSVPVMNEVLAPDIKSFAPPAAEISKLGNKVDEVTFTDTRLPERLTPHSPAIVQP